MKHEKQISDRARFWIGVIACIMVGAIASTVSYFSSAHIFNNGYKMHNIFIRVYDVIDTNKSVGLWQNRDNYINADLVVKNTGELPVLLRIKYNLANKWSRLNSSNTNDWHFYDDKNKSYYNCLDLSILNGVAVNKDKFLFNGGTELWKDDTDPNYDGYYYYRGVLQPTDLIQHLDGINRPSSDTQHYSDPWFYQGLDNDKKEIWKRNSDTTIETKSIGKSLYSFNSHFANINGPSLPFKIRATVEAIQATDEDGKSLDAKEVANLDVAGLKKLWTDLGK